MKHPFYFLVLLTALASCKDHTSADSSKTLTEKTSDPAPQELTYTVMNLLPHDTTSYTEGFFVHDGKLFESSGAPADLPQTKSVFGTVNPQSGKLQVLTSLDRKKYFGEGAVWLNGKFYVLTWQTKTGFIYDGKTYKPLGTFSFPSAEGWGMTTDGQSLIMSDGSSNITFLDPNTFKINRIITVTDNNGPVAMINELEWVHGFIYSNVYETNTILKIDASSGMVVGKADFSQLDKEAKVKYGQAEYMNGIAYDSVRHKMYVTGKLWPTIYEVKIVGE